MLALHFGRREDDALQAVLLLQKRDRFLPGFALPEDDLGWVIGGNRIFRREDLRVEIEVGDLPPVAAGEVVVGRVGGQQRLVWIMLVTLAWARPRFLATPRRA